MPPKKVQTQRQALAAVQEAVRRARAIEKVDFDELAFGPQLDFIRDDSHLVAAVCGRQSGKTEAEALLLLDTAQRNPHQRLLYITLSRPSAKRIMWPKLQAWNRKLELKAKFNHQELTMTLPNGAIIELGGANDEAEIERYRGVTTPLVVLDECQAFRPYLKSLIGDILQPTTIALNGRIVMIGTPNPSCHGFFHDATTGKEPGWSVHHWTIHQNVHVPHAEAWLEKHVVKQRGVRRDDPRFKREWLGLWVKDSSGLVYPVPHHALIEELPEDVDDWNYVLGMDVGYVDATAFVTMAYSITANKVVTVCSHQRTELIPSAIAVEVEKLCSQFDYEAIVIDPGGGGKPMVEELKQRYGMPAEVAEKRAKSAAIDVLVGDLRSGAMNIIEWSNEELLHDASLLQWNYARFDKRMGHDPDKARQMVAKDLLQIDDRTPDHLLDAQLYAHRKCRAYLHEDELNPPKAGTPEATKLLEKQLLDQARAKLNEELNPSSQWWEL